MISVELNIDNHCHNCDKFYGIMAETRNYADDKCIEIINTVQCAHMDRCRYLIDYLKKEMQKDDSIKD